MGSKIKEKAKECESNVLCKRGIANNILNKFDNKLMDKIVKEMEELILNKLAISDDLLLACWKYNSKPIWNAIKKNIQEICNNPIRDCNWYWYKLYLSNSAIWYEKKFENNSTNDDGKDEVKTNNEKDEKLGVMYDNLVKIVNDTLNHEQSELLKQFNQLKMNQAESFNEMVTFPPYMVQDKDTSENGLRQDNEKLLKYANKLQFDEKTMKNVEKFELKDLCNSHIYLSSLMVIANTLNEPFHKDIQKMVLECGGKGEYTSGPVKKISRAQAKAESDYALCPFPTSANVIDLIRGTVVYPDCKTLMHGLNGIINKIKNNNGGCIKQVLRIKNMFIENKKDYPQEWMKKYGDIKLNVLIEYNGASMIGELQFLLQCVLDDKKKKHKMYEITRNEEFINIMNGVLKVSSKIHENFLSVVHGQNVDELAKCLFNNYYFGHGNYNSKSKSDEIDLNKKDNDGKGFNAFEYCCEFGNMKMMKLLMSAASLTSNSNTKYKDSSLLHIAADESNFEMLECMVSWLKKHDALDVISAKAVHQRKNDYTSYSPLMWSANSKKNYDEEKPSECDNFKCFKLLLKLLWKQKHADIDINEVLSKLMYNHKHECVLYVLDRVEVYDDKLKDEQDGQSQLESKSHALIDEKIMFKLDKRFKNFGCNYLMIAAEYGNFEVLSKIWDLGAFDDVNCVDTRWGRTALIYLAKRLSHNDWDSDLEKKEIDKFYRLLTERKDVDKTIRDKDGKTAQDYYEFKKV